MKKHLLSSLVYLAPSFFLSALQGNLYFLPFSLPMIWCLILALYSFKKSLLNSLLLNIAHTLIIVSFTTVSASRLILYMNIFTLGCYFVRERFHTNRLHIALTSGALSFTFMLSQWSLNLLSRNIYLPDFLAWTGSALSTIIFAPILIFFLEPIDQKIQTEKVETLENLRI